MRRGLLDAATTPTDASYWGRIVLAMALMAAGLAFTTGPATDAIMGALPAGKAGAGSAVNDTTREVGGTLGVAIVGSVLNSAYGAHVLHGLVSLGAPASVGRVAGQSVVAGMTVAARFPEPLRPPRTTRSAPRSWWACTAGRSWRPARWRWPGWWRWPSCRPGQRSSAAVPGGAAGAGWCGRGAEDKSVARTDPADSGRSADSVKASRA